MKTFFLLDGSNYVFRAYYGLPELTDDDGHNVNAIYGFFRMMFRLRQQKPDSFMIAWDAPVKTFRKEIDDTYKANRVSMPDNFKWQMGMIKELVGQLNISAEEMPGFEADDIIYTLVQHAGDHQHSTVFKIVSSDKDLKQMLSENVVMYDAMKNKVTDPQGFIDEYGFPPVQIVDYLSLVGDSSDNIPGVRGIGKVSALKLVQEYGGLDAIYQNIEAISGSVQTKLIEGKEDAYASKHLIQLVDIPEMADHTLESYKCNFDFELMREVLVRGYKFSSLEKYIDELKKSYEQGEQLSLFG